jgi:hypothetical protein
MTLPRALAQQPQQGVPIDWSNPITRGLAFAYVPGISFDLAGRFGSARFNGSVGRLGGSLVLSGAVSSGLMVGSGPLLGPLQNSTVVAVVASTATVTSGKAFYCERAPTGADIYKLEAAGGGGSSGCAQFTYRNDGNALLQVQSSGMDLTDGTVRLYAATKSGTTHSVHAYPINDFRAGGSSVTGTFGSSDTSFTNASISRTIGYDAGDSAANASGHIDLTVGWTRALTKDEIRSLAQNPWQIFKGGSPLASATMAAVAVSGAVSTPTTIATSVGGVSSSGLAATIVTPTAVTCSTASVSATGQKASIVLPVTVSCSAGAASASGLAAQVSTPTTISATTASVASTGRAANISTGSGIACATAGVQAFGLTASIVIPTTISATCAAVTAAGLAASVGNATVISCATAGVSAQGRTASLGLGRNPVSVRAMDVSPAHTVVFGGGVHTVAFDGGTRVVNF